VIPSTSSTPSNRHDRGPTKSRTVLFISKQNKHQQQTENKTMKFQKIVFITLSSVWSLVAAQNRNVQMGMEGLMQMGQDPELMAQLFQDMQVSTTCCWWW
jgi:hypothetical protein